MLNTHSSTAECSLQDEEPDLDDPDHTNARLHSGHVQLAQRADRVKPVLLHLGIGGQRLADSGDAQQEPSSPFTPFSPLISTPNHDDLFHLGHHDDDVIGRYSAPGDISQSDISSSPVSKLRDTARDIYRVRAISN
jgi:hypothetical protein